MTYLVHRLEVEGQRVVASSSARNRHSDLWRAQNEAERLARKHDRSTFDQELACWRGHDPDGRTFRYFAVRA